MQREKFRVTICDAQALIALVAGVFWFAGELIWDGKIPFYRDLGPYFYPIRWAVAESLNRGELPLWNRHMAAGFPLLADFQSAAFYPPHLIFLCLPFFKAISILFVFHLLVAAAGAYLLCRHWGYSTCVALIGAVLFAFGGVTVSLTNLLNHFQAAVWLPWLVLAAERFADRRGWGNFLVFVLISLVAFLAGSPEFFVMCMALAALGCFKLRAGNPRALSYGKTLMAFIGAGGLVAALAMVQLAPTVELLLNSRRTQPIPTVEALDWSLSPVNLLNLFLLDREVDRRVLTGVRLFFIERTPFFISYYLGLLWLFGLVLWIGFSDLREKAVGFGLLACSLVLAMGGYTPIYPLLLEWVPILAVVRFPEKFFFLTYAILWFVATRGIAEFFDGDASRQRRSVIFLLASWMILVGFYLYVALEPGRIATAISAKATASSAIASLLVSLERQLLIGAGLLVVFFASARSAARLALLQALLVVIAFVDLERVHRPYLFPLDPAVVDRTSKVLEAPALGRGRIFYYPAGASLHPSQYSVLARPTFEGAISLVNRNLLPNTGIFQGHDYFQEIDALSRWPYLSFLAFTDRAGVEERLRLLSALNVEHVISFRELPHPGITLVRHFPEFPSWVYKMNRTVPRVYLVNRAINEERPQGVLRRLTSEDFEVTQQVILERAVPLEKQQGDFVLAAKILRYENHSVTVEASLNTPGVLVLTDSYYPGWKAYVDGNQAEILRANLFFRAVTLSAGEHTVEFKYEPISFGIGLAVSMATALILVVSCAISFLRGKSDRMRRSGWFLS